MVVPYGAYRCADGEVMLAVQTDREWRRLCAGVLGNAGLADNSLFATNENRVRNRVELEALIEAAFGGLTRAEAVRLLEAADIPTATVNDVAAAAAHQQLSGRGRWVSVDSEAGAFSALMPPHNLRGAPSAMRGVPGIGEHSAEIRAELA
jgi:crotonobetainyl-CoA:carnitine CoA-transferase CaiB-like acyl-CoA transferase